LHLAAQYQVIVDVLFDAQEQSLTEAKRDLDNARWWDCFHSGLPWLRNVGEPTARTVMTALETTQTGRAAISQDWPDAPALRARHGQGDRLGQPGIG
jgi:hypothetical protein